MIYILVFFISFIFCSLGNKYEKRKIASTIFLSLAVLVVSLLAGVRDLNIGSDIMTYGHWMFLGAKNTTSLINYVQYYTDIDVGYSIFVYIISRFFSKEHWLYFFTGIIIYGFTMVGIKRFDKYISLPWTWLIFLFLLYGDTLNAMRQSIAMAIVLYSFSYVVNNRYKLYFFWTAIAFTFHNTALLSLGIFALYMILKIKDTLKIRMFISTVTVIAVLLYNKIIIFFISIGLLHEKFIRYVSSNFVFNSLNPIIVRLPFFIIMFIFLKSLKKYKTNDNLSSKDVVLLTDFLFLMSFIEMIVAEMRLVNVSMYRLAFYFTLFRCILMGRTVNVLKYENKSIIKMLFILLLMIIWIYQNVIQGNNEIYPFTSELIGL